MRQETQLSLTNRATRLRSPNMVTFHMLGMVSYVLLLILLPGCAIFQIYSTSKNVLTLKSGSEVT